MNSRVVLDAVNRLVLFHRSVRPNIEIGGAFVLICILIEIFFRILRKSRLLALCGLSLLVTVG